MRSLHLEAGPLVLDVVQDAGDCVLLLGPGQVIRLMRDHDSSTAAYRSYSKWWIRAVIVPQLLLRRRLSCGARSSSAGLLIHVSSFTPSIFFSQKWEESPEQKKQQRCWPTTNLFPSLSRPSVAASGFSAVCKMVCPERAVLIASDWGRRVSVRVRVCGL